MKYLINKLTALLIMLMCVSAAAQAEIVHHDVCEPTLSSRGFTQECWEDTQTGKIYSDASCTQELVNEDLAKAVVYKKLLLNPISYTDGFSPSEHERDWGVNLNWAAVTTFMDATAEIAEPRCVKFTVAGYNVTNARLVWNRNRKSAYDNGKFTVRIFVNDVEKFSRNQDHGEEFEGVFVQSLPGLKKGDVVKFEVSQQEKGHNFPENGPTFKASLEYTGKFAIHHSVCEPTLSTLGFTQECWELEGKFYSDADCINELKHHALAKTVVYSRLPLNPI